MNRIDEAVNYNQQHLLKIANSKRKLPSVDCVLTHSVQTQVDFLLTFTIDRFSGLYIGGLHSELSKILDIFNSDYACLLVDSSLILISFNMESKSSK